MQNKKFSLQDFKGKNLSRKEMKQIGGGNHVLPAGYKCFTPGDIQPIGYVSTELGYQDIVIRLLL